MLEHFLAIFNSIGGFRGGGGHTLYPHLISADLGIFH